MSTEYNGWRNIETWRVQLHLQNNSELYAEAARLTLHALKVAEADKTHDADRILATRLGNYVSDQIHELLPDPKGDGIDMLLMDTVDTALRRVDWDEIAQHWIVAVGQSRVGNLGRAAT